MIVLGCSKGLFTGFWLALDDLRKQDFFLCCEKSKLHSIIGNHNCRFLEGETSVVELKIICEKLQSTILVGKGEYWSLL